MQWDGPWGPAKGSRSSKSNYVHLVRSSVLCDAGWAGCMTLQCSRGLLKGL